MSFLSQLFGKKDAAQRDARRIYSLVMQQSREPVFYGPDRFPDNYDGRIDVLTLHMGIVFEALRDTGVAKRIKPMIRLFYTRVKTYTENFESGDLEKIAASLHKGDEKSFSKGFGSSLARYVTKTRESLESKSLGELAQTSFSFADVKCALFATW